MKLAISTDGNSLTSKIDQRFGRCKSFIIFEDGEEFKVIDNKGAEQGHGAGIKAAEQLGEMGVKSVITGAIGPNVSAIFEKIEIKAYHASGIVEEAIQAFQNNELKEIEDIAEPHSGEVQKKETERIFFPLLDNNGLNSQISAHFGHAPFFGLYEVEEKKFSILDNNLNHTDPSKSPIDQIEEAVNPTTIFAKGIGGRAIQLIQQKGLELKTGNFNTVQEVIDKLDCLEDQTQSCGHEHNH